MNKGFIALIMTLSVAGILLGLVLTSSIESATFFDQALRKEYREMNYYYAYDCIDQAMLMLSHDYFFSLTSAITIPKYNCTILSIENQGNLRRIYTRGDFQKAYVYRHATVKLGDHRLDVISIE